MRFFIVDDHPLMREGLRLSITGQKIPFEFLGDAGDVESAASRLVDLDVDLIIVDHSIRSKTGLDLIRALRPSHPNTQYLLVTQCEDPEVLTRYHELGIDGMISKLNASEKIREALEHLTQKKKYICPFIEEILQAPRPTSLLTQREFEIVKLMTQGKTNKEIALILSCSDQTIKTHKANLMRKLNLSSSVEVSVWAIKNNLI